jgi:predicted RNA-binding Zn-ribbon protein involved in translation (DUF1610 family)
MSARPTITVSCPKCHEKFLAARDVDSHGREIGPAVGTCPHCGWQGEIPTPPQSV